MVSAKKSLDKNLYDLFVEQVRRLEILWGKDIKQCFLKSAGEYAIHLKYLSVFRG